ncbi:MAG TPA: 4-(cytidine 5'-diphospho)-2-C-methyl-D-erythritol kinase [Thermoleophilaceae bacterium]|nr:4-(cytidine 5'-diphospho)-2-C-methyl-D-erythritol kinase [Thermoleophilaceae bacterium]
MLRELAYAKLNLVLHVGPRRDDGMHPICSIVASIDLADEVRAEPKDSGEDTVECVGVSGDNLAARALAEFRSRAGGALPPLAVTIEKRIPVAAGLGGGSADAAATLRIANRLAERPLGAEELLRLAAGLGSDVPSQLEPRHALVHGTGERIESLTLPALSAVLIPDEDGLSTGTVYAELDRLDGARQQLDAAHLRELAGRDPATALHNDLQPAALSLRPDLQERLDALLAAGALGAAVSGSGPTCFGLFADREAAERAAEQLPGALVTALR